MVATLAVRKYSLIIDAPRTQTPLLNLIRSEIGNRNHYNIMCTAPNLKETL